jgi:hypothetical protein
MRGDSVPSAVVTAKRLIAGPPPEQAATLVTVALSATKAGTEATLTHERLPSPQTRHRHNIGWADLLDHLSDIALRSPAA